MSSSSHVINAMTLITNYFWTPSTTCAIAHMFLLWDLQVCSQNNFQCAVIHADRFKSCPSRDLIVLQNRVTPTKMCTYPAKLFKIVSTTAIPCVSPVCLCSTYFSVPGLCPSAIQGPHIKDKVEFGKKWPVHGHTLWGPNQLLVRHYENTLLLKVLMLSFPLFSVTPSHLLSVLTWLLQHGIKHPNFPEVAGVLLQCCFLIF